MPRGDRTGPMGMGPMTGRGAGFCSGVGVPGFMNAMPARGGMGMGRGAAGVLYGYGVETWLGISGCSDRFSTGFKSAG